MKLDNDLTDQIGSNLVIHICVVTWLILFAGRMNR